MGSILTNLPTIVTTNRKVTENTVVNSLAAWLTFDQLVVNLKVIGGRDAPHRHILPAIFKLSHAFNVISQICEYIILFCAMTIFLFIFVHTSGLAVGKQ